MHTFAQKQKPTQKGKSVSLTTPSRPFTGQSREVSSILNLQRTVGNQAVQRLLPIKGEDREDNSLTEPSPNFSHDFSRIPIHENANIQTKLTVNTPGDEYEQEANRVADQVMTMPAPQRRSGEENTLQMKGGPTAEKSLSFRGNTSVSPSGEPSIRSILTGGRAFNEQERRFFEPRMGTDFSHVRLHSDPVAANAATEIGARAFAVGNHIALAEGEYNFHSPQGKHLMAHELTHVIQQKQAASLSSVVQRQDLGGLSSADADLAAEREYGDSGAPKAQKCGSPSHCPAGFCDPYRSEELAKYYRAKKSGWLMLGISAAVDSKVVPLWREYLMGGSSPKDLSTQFGKDFTKSPTTKNATSFLHRELVKKLNASPPNVPESTSVSLDLSAEIPSAIAKLDDPASPNLTSKTGGKMNFNIPKDIPGNIAGDIGKNQTACLSGAKPSPFNDERHASGYAEAVRSGNNITVTPMIEYKVKDTIDLCPGDCGTTLEQIATVPLSQFEATGISGDVPFTVNFPAPSHGSFTISAPP